MKAEAFFCKTWVFTHHEEEQIHGVGINIGCIDAIDPFEYEAGFVDMKNKYSMSLEFLISKFKIINFYLSAGQEFILIHQELKLKMQRIM